MKKEDDEINLEELKTLFPIELLDYLFEMNGIDINDESDHLNNLKRTSAAIVEKIISDVVKDCDYFHKINSKMFVKSGIKINEKKKTLNVEDVEQALNKIGIDINSLHYMK